MKPVYSSRAFSVRWCRRWASFVALAGAAFSAHAQPQAQNDSGQSTCYNAAHVAVLCSAAVGGDAGVNPRQDGRYGRDAAIFAGLLPKLGAGSAAFDYTKISNAGNPLGAGVALGTQPNEWACTKDNVTGLTWEVKTAAGLRAGSHSYVWFSADALTNGGNAGPQGTDSCGGTLAAAPYNNRCNTAYFVSAVNAQGLCGATDWRLPSQRELLSLVHSGATNPSFDLTYFPHAPNEYYFWSATSRARDSAEAWFVFFGNGSTGTNYKTITHPIWLVRGGL
jgi:hypothetical protein